MKKLFIYVILLTGLIASANKTFAQVFPVTVTTNVTPPYSMKLSDYVNASYERIQATIFMADPLAVNYKYKIRLVIKGPGNLLLTTIPGEEAGPYFINGNETHIYKGSELSSLFDPGNLIFNGITQQEYNINAGLPEGFYQFQFEILDWNLNLAVSNVNSGFANAWLMLNDPPLINQPVNEATITPLTPQNIFFQWTPRHTGSPNSAFSTVYDLQLVEIFPSTRSANDAMLSSPPIFEYTTAATAYNYGIADPILVEGKWYAFRVRAYAQNGLDLFKNQGYSEVYRFYYGSACPTVTDLAITPIDASNALLSFTAAPSHQTVEVEYKRSSANWSSAQSVIASVDERVSLRNLEPGERYEIRVKGVCMNNTSDYDTISFTTTDPTQVTLTGGACSVPYEESITATQVDSNSFRITWGGGTNFTQYRFRYRLLGSNNLFEEILTSEKFVVVTGLNRDVVYEYQVQYKCVNNQWATGNSNVFTIDYDPNTTVGTGTGSCYYPSSIRAQVLSSTSAEIAWESEPGVRSYQIFYRPIIVVGINEAWDSVTTDRLRLRLRDLLLNTQYEFYIRSLCTDGKYSLNSDVNLFNTGEINSFTGTCMTPTLRPAEPQSDVEAVVSWEPRNEYTKYKIEYRKRDQTEWMVTEDTVFRKYLSSLVASTQYDYQVTAFCGTVISQPTAIDTFTTLDSGRVINEFHCGDPIPDASPGATTPISDLNVGDMFDAADFDLKVAALTSERPYNGSAIVEIPYLEHSKVEFIMQDVWVNENHKMYQGRVIFKGVLITVIDPALANQISGFLDDLDDFMGDLSHNLAVADSIQDALNESIGQLSQPIDWDQYDGWTAQQFLDTARAMAVRAQTLMTSGNVSSVLEGKVVMVQAIELIRMAAGLGTATFNALSDFAKKLKLKLLVILDTMRADFGRRRHTDSLALVGLTPSLNQKYEVIQPSTTDAYEMDPTDFIIGSMNASPDSLNAEDTARLATGDLTGAVFREGVIYRKKEYIVMTSTIIIEYITKYSRDANMVRLARRMERDLREEIGSLDLDALSPEQLDNVTRIIKRYLEKVFLLEREMGHEEQ